MADMTQPTIGKLEIGENKTDPTLMALLSQKGGMLGGQDGGLLLLLLLSMFNRGGLGGEAATSSKDVAAQLSSFQGWASTNSAQIAQSICGIDKSICCSTRDIVAAVNALTPQMFQQFVSLEKSIDGVQSKLQECCCANQLAVANQNALIERNTAVLQNQAGMNHANIMNELAKQTCEIKQSIAADGQATRTLIQSIETDRLRQELNDTKAALSNCQQTGTFSTILNTTQSQQTQQILAAIESVCGGNGVKK